MQQQVATSPTPASATYVFTTERTRVRDCVAIIGGPRELRQHVRQELREHLLDAVAQHKAAGLPEDRALAQALEDFGGPEQLRAELEATHGHRGMAVVIDKAIEWKEKTMKAKWL